MDKNPNLKPGSTRDNSPKDRARARQMIHQKALPKYSNTKYCYYRSRIDHADEKNVVCWAGRICSQTTSTHSNLYARFSLLLVEQQFKTSTSRTQKKLRRERAALQLPAPDVKQPERQEGCCWWETRVLAFGRIRPCFARKHVDDRYRRTSLGRNSCLWLACLPPPSKEHKEHKEHKITRRRRRFPRSLCRRTHLKHTTRT